MQSSLVLQCLVSSLSTAPCVKAAEEDNVIWSKDPLMITVRREKDEFSNLTLSIVPRKVNYQIVCMWVYDCASITRLSWTGA